MDIDAEVEDLHALEQALEDGLNKGAKESADWSVDEGKNKAQDLLRIGDSRGHSRIWTRETYKGFRTHVERRGTTFHAEIQNVSPHAHIVEHGRRPGAIPPPVQALMEWVVDKLDPAPVYDHDGDGGDDDDIGTEWWEYDSSDDNTVVASGRADQEWQDTWDNELEGNADEWDVRVDEYKDLLSDEYSRLTDNADVRIRAHFGNVKSILQDGRFKPQHETGTSSGALNPSYRRKFETKWFGYDGDTPDSEMPIYGYLGDQRSSYSDPTVGIYGDVTFRLKDDVHERTSFTFDDSLDTNASSVTDDFARGVSSLPTWFTDPGHKADKIRYALQDPETQLEKLRNLNSVAEVSPYVEAQIHGGVTIEDIAEVIFKDEPPTEEMKELLNQAGIPWRTE